MTRGLPENGYEMRRTELDDCRLVSGAMNAYLAPDQVPGKTQ